MQDTEIPLDCSDNTNVVESSVMSQSSNGLVHVNLDFNDGIRGEVYLEPAIVTRLQQGDSELMEQLRCELYGNAIELVESRESSDVLQPSEFVSSDNTVADDISVELTYNNPVSTTTTDTTAAHNVKRKSELIDIISEQDEVKKIKLETDRSTDVFDKNTDSGTVTMIERLKETNHMDFTADKKFPLKKKLPRPRRYLKYSLEDRDKATQLVLDGKMTISEVQKQFGIPPATMCDMVKRVGGTRFKCDLCSKGFPMEYMLEKHRQQHFRNNLCSYCGHGSINQCALKRHIFTCHPGEAEQEYGDEYINYTLTKFKCNKWKYQNTRQLFEEYGKLLQSEKSLHENVHVWIELADTFWNQNFCVTPAQVQRKWRTLFRSYKLFKEGGQKDKQPRFYQEMESFLQVHAGRSIDFGEVEDVVDDNAHKKEDNTVNTKQSIWTAELVTVFLQEMEQRVEAFKDPFVEDKKIWCEIAKILCKGGIVVGSKHLEVTWNQLKKTCKEKGWDIPMPISGDDSVIDDDSEEDYKCYGVRLCQLIKIMDERDDKITDLECIPDEYYKNSVPQMWDTDAITKIIEYYDEYLTSVKENPEPNTSKNIVFDFIASKMQKAGYTMVSHQIEARWTVFLREVSKPTTDSIEFPCGKRLLEVLKREEILKEESLASTNAAYTVWTNEVGEIFLDEYIALLTSLSSSVEVDQRELFSAMSLKMKQYDCNCTATQLVNRWRIYVCEYKYGEITEGFKNKVEQLICILQSCKSYSVSTPSPKPTTTLSLRKQQRQVMQSDEAIEVKTSAKSRHFMSTKLLITEYGKRLDQFDDPTVENEVLWDEITEVFRTEGFPTDAIKLEKKWLNLVEQYKQALKEENSETTEKRTFYFMDDMRDILGLFSDDELHSDVQSVEEVTMSSSDIFENTGECKEDKCGKIDEIVEFNDVLSTRENTNDSDIEEDNLVENEDTYKQYCEEIEKGNDSNDSDNVQHGSCSCKKALKDMLTYITDSSTYRRELETKHTEILNQMNNRMLPQVKSLADMVNYFKRYENKRTLLEKQRTKELEKMQTRKINALTKLLNS